MHDTSDSGWSEPLELKYVSFLDTLHPRHACWVLAVAAGLKPSAMIESIDFSGWNVFVELLEKMGMCFAYQSNEQMVMGLADDQLDDFGLSKEVAGKHAYLLFDSSNWQRMLHGKSTNFDVRLESSNLRPTVKKGLDVQEVFVARSPMQLIKLAQSRHGGPELEWDAESAGKALGYPQCCIDSYIRLGSSGLAARQSFLRGLREEGMDQSMPVEFWSVYHIPCSAHCKRSIELGRSYLESIRCHSELLYNSVLDKLRCSHLAYSVGERFLDYAPMQERSHMLYRKEKVIDRSRSMIGTQVNVELGNIRRPFLYVDEEYGQAKLHLTSKVIGPKWIAFSPGIGALIQDVENDEIYLYLKSEMLGDSARFCDMAFQVYKSV